MSDIEVRVKKIIAEQLGVEESQVTNVKPAAIMNNVLAWLRPFKH